MVAERLVGGGAVVPVAADVAVPQAPDRRRRCGRRTSPRAAPRRPAARAPAGRRLRRSPGDGALLPREDLGQPGLELVLPRLDALRRPRHVLGGEGQVVPPLVDLDRARAPALPPQTEQPRREAALQERPQARPAGTDQGAGVQAVDDRLRPARERAGLGVPAAVQVDAGEAEVRREHDADSGEVVALRPRHGLVERPPRGGVVGLRRPPGLRVDRAASSTASPACRSASSTRPPTAGARPAPPGPGPGRSGRAAPPAAARSGRGRRSSPAHSVGVYASSSPTRKRCSGRRGPRRPG